MMALLLIMALIPEGGSSKADSLVEETLVKIPASDFSSWSALAPRPLLQNSQGVSWTLSMPSHTSPHDQLTVSDVCTTTEYRIEKFSFDVVMFGLGGLDRLDEYAVFASVQPYNKFEFGVRMSASDGRVMGYTIYTPPGSDYIISEVALFQNDGLRHHYEIDVQEDMALFTVDGGRSKFISGYSFGGEQYGITATAHRTTEGWSSEGFYMVFENLQFVSTK